MTNQHFNLIYKNRNGAIASLLVRQYGDNYYTDVVARKRSRVLKINNRGLYPIVESISDGTDRRGTRTVNLGAYKGLNLVKPCAGAPDTVVLWICDNGATYCRDHLGETARTTGRDISGQEIEPIIVTPDNPLIGCETCRNASA